MKTSSVSKIIQILTALQSGQGYTVCDLAALLRVSRRTVFRDLHDLQKAGVPAHYDSKVSHYTIDPKFFLSAARPNHSRGDGPVVACSQNQRSCSFSFYGFIFAGNP